MEGSERERERGSQRVPVNAGGTPEHHTPSKFDLLDRRYYEGAPVLFVSTPDIALLLHMLSLYFPSLLKITLFFLSHFKVDHHPRPLSSSRISTLQ